MLQQELLTWLASDNGFAVNCSVFVLLVLGGLGFPIPEDLPLLLAGVAASKGIVDLKQVAIVSYFGVLIADQLIYGIGYFFGQRLILAGERSPFLPAITPERVQEVREGLRKKRLLYIFIGRHLFPVRSVTFITAGALRIPYLEFLIPDALAALVSVSIVIGIGYYLGGTLTPEITSHLISKAHYYISGIALLCILGWIMRRIMKKNSNKQVDKTLSPSKTEC